MDTYWLVFYHDGNYNKAVIVKDTLAIMPFSVNVSEQAQLFDGDDQPMLNGIFELYNFDPSNVPLIIIDDKEFITPIRETKLVE